MGIEFRDAYYYRFVRLGKRTIKDGEAAVVWNSRGVARTVVGPKYEYLYFSAIRFLSRVVATADEFIALRHADGTTEHIRGPARFFVNPVLHDPQHTVVKQLLRLDSPTEVLVVLREEPLVEGTVAAAGVTSALDSAAPNSARVAEGKGVRSGGMSMRRLIIEGPANFMPLPSDRVVSFTWTGRTPSPILSTAPQRTDVKVVIGEGDLTVGVTVSVLYRIADVAALHEAGPEANIITTINFAVQEDTSSLVSLTSSSDTTALRAALTDPGTYARCARDTAAFGITIMEFNVSKFQVSHALSGAEESQARLASRLRDAAAQAEHDEALATAALAAKRERAEAERALATEAQNHELALATARHEAEANMRQQQNEEVLQFLRELRSVDVDLTKFLCHPSGANPTAQALLTRAPAVHGLVGTALGGGGVPPPAPPGRFDV